VFIAVSFLSLLILTTQFSEIISALRFFKIPESIISILVLTYRYIHLTFSELFRILVARESRRVRKMKISEIWNGGGASLGVFFIRVLERAERIYLSSIARGGQNYRPYVFPLRFRSTEAFFTSMVLANIIWWLI
jgi:cobalt/nickel transport system permease protein